MVGQQVHCKLRMSRKENNKTILNHRRRARDRDGRFVMEGQVTSLENNGRNLSLSPAAEIRLLVA
jgi:hypothetical protein